jgi:hypothetical protein
MEDSNSRIADCRKECVRAARPRYVRFPAGKDRAKGKGKMSKDGQIKKKTREIALKKNPSRSRPMKVVVNGQGSPWICDLEVDPSKDLAAQGCWQLRDDRSTRSKEKSQGKKPRNTS